MRDRLALAWHSSAPRPGLGQRLADRLLDDRVRAGGQGGATLGVGAQRLCCLGSVAVDRQRLDPQMPGLCVGVGDVLDAGLRWQVHGLRDGPRDEGLNGAHHLQVAHVRDRPLADGHVEHRQVLVGQSGRPDDRAVLGQISLDLLDLLL